MARLFGFLINDEAEEEGGGGGGGNSISGEVSRSGMQPDGEAMSLSVGSPPLGERENNPYLRFLESKPDSGSAHMDSESDLRNCFIDFFDRESYEVDEFHTAGPNQRPSPCDLDIWGDNDMEEEKIELGLGIGSGSGQLFGDSGGVQVTGNKEIDSGRVEVVTDLNPLRDDLLGVEDGTEGTEFDDLSDEGMIVDDGEFEWEDSQNTITLVSFPVQVTSFFSLEEEGEEDEEEGEEEDVEEDVEEEDEEPGIIPRPPALKSVVDGLPLMEFTSQELSSGNIVCAICREDILVEEKVNKLPCRHYYHGDCIIHWLGIRNTCPVCRYELPTDDVEYERYRRSQRQGT